LLRAFSILVRRLRVPLSPKFFDVLVIYFDVLANDAESTMAKLGAYVVRPDLSKS
jgi:hypothetical protein